MGPLYEVRQDWPREAFVYARVDRMGLASDKPASAQEDQMKPIDPATFDRIPPQKRVAWIVKRVLNQSRKQAALEAARKAFAPNPGPQADFMASPLPAPVYPGRG